MMAATQPFLSGAISKTVNLPTDCTVDDIAEAYTEAWRLGLKAVAIYRDGSKGTQPLNVSMTRKKSDKPTTIDAAADRASARSTPVSTPPSPPSSPPTLRPPPTSPPSAKTRHHRRPRRRSSSSPTPHSPPQLEALRRSITEGNDTLDAQAPPVAIRHRLPAERASITHKFSVGGHEGYVTVGLYPNGQPGEIFIRMAKEGSTISGLMDSFATAVSLCLQHGVPLKVLCEKFAHTRFEPSGWTGDEQIGYAKSLMDYLFRWMQLRFLSGHQLSLFNLKSLEAQPAQAAPTLALTDAVPVAGTVNAPDNTVVPNPPAYDVWAGRAPAITDGSSAEHLNDRRAPQQGIAPDLVARTWLPAMHRRPAHLEPRISNPRTAASTTPPPP